MRADANAILAIAQRDLLKFLRDRARLISTFVFPFVFIALLGGSLQSAFGGSGGGHADFLFFVFTGVYAQTLFQSSALGLISLLEDRDNDFSQELFIAPVSRYSIIFGKILGESLVSLAQAVVLIGFGFVIGLHLTLTQLTLLLPVSVVICFFGGAFGVLVLASISTQRAAQQIFPFVILPQFFLSGVFNPIYHFPLWLDVLSRISPMRYAVDLARDALYQGRVDDVHAVLATAPFNLAVMSTLFMIFMVVGTTLFVRREKNR